jgi:hypothetical protein
MGTCEFEKEILENITLLGAYKNLDQPILEESRL